MIICHLFWRVEPKIQFPRDTLRMSKHRPQQDTYKKSCCFFTWKLQKAIKSCSSFYRARCPDRLLNGSCNQNPPGTRSIQHNLWSPAANLQEAIWGAVNQTAAGLAAQLCSAACVAKLYCWCLAAQSGTDWPKGFPSPTAATEPKSKSNPAWKSSREADLEEEFTRWLHEQEVSGGLWHARDCF